MRVLVQDQNGLYLTSNNEWSTKITDAKDFKSINFFPCDYQFPKKSKIIYDFSDEYGSERFNFWIPIELAPLRGFEPTIPAVKER